MIHAIYIYFIINAFVAGKRFIWDGWKYAVYLFLFAIPHHIIVIVFALFMALLLWIDNNTWIGHFYRLWFTDKYKNAKPIEDLLKKRVEANGFLESLFLKKYLKKYPNRLTEP